MNETKRLALNLDRQETVSEAYRAVDAMECKGGLTAEEARKARANLDAAQRRIWCAVG